MIHLLRGLYYGIYSAKDFRCRDNKCLFFQREPFLKIDFFLQDISCLSEGNIYFSMITLMLLMSLSDSEDIVPLFYFFFFFAVVLYLYGIRYVLKCSVVNSLI